MSEFTVNNARELISNLKWTFAKTYAKTSPHEYSVVKVGDPYRDEVVSFMKFIFDEGYEEKYYGHPFMVYKLDDRKYWSMAKKKEEINDDNYIINRTAEGLQDKVYS